MVEGITKPDLYELADKLDDIQHTTTRHAIINYLISNNWIDTDGQIYYDLMRMDKKGVIKREYQY